MSYAAAAIPIRIEGVPINALTNFSWNHTEALALRKCLFNEELLLPRSQNTRNLCCPLKPVDCQTHTLPFPIPPSITPFPVSSHRAPETSWKCSEVKRGANTKLLSAGWIQGTAQEQLVQWGCGCPIPAGTQGQAGCGSGQPGLLVGDPAHSRGLELEEHCGPFQPRAFYDSMTTAKCYLWVMATSAPVCLDRTTLIWDESPKVIWKWHSESFVHITAFLCLAPYQFFMLL